MNMLEFFRDLLNPRFSVYKETHKWLHDQKIKHEAAQEMKSTNILAKEEAFSLSIPLKAYLANQQSQGRGRGSNSWENPGSDEALLMSFSFSLKGAPQPIATALTGLAVYRSLNTHFPGLPLSLKAPNDLLLGEKKVAGILVESVQMGEQNRLIIGIGLNVFGSPNSLPESTHMSDFCRTKASLWKTFLTDLLAQLRLVSQESLGTHLNETQRLEILQALNKNPNLNAQVESISPFGDLNINGQVTSWRDL